MIGTVMDIETTGYLAFDKVDGKSVLSDSNEILEVGYININLNTGRIIKYGTLYFYKPYFQIENDAQRIHGLTREFLKQYENDFEKNLCILNTLMQQTVIIGKNSEHFDIPFVKHFLSKHGKDVLDIPTLVTNLAQRTYNEGKLIYSQGCLSWDMQTAFKEEYHRLYKEAYGVKVGVGVAESDIMDKLCKYTGITQGAIEECLKLHGFATADNRTSWYYPDKEHPAIANTKKGSLTAYLDVIPDGWETTNGLYATLDKERVTGAHGALYDCVATFVVWYYCKINNLL